MFHLSPLYYYSVPIPAVHLFSRPGRMMDGPEFVFESKEEVARVDVNNVVEAKLALHLRRVPLVHRYRVAPMGRHESPALCLVKGPRKKVVVVRLVVRTTTTQVQGNMMTVSGRNVVARLPKD